MKQSKSAFSVTIGADLIRIVAILLGLFIINAHFTLYLWLPNYEFNHLFTVSPHIIAAVLLLATLSFFKLKTTRPIVLALSALNAVLFFYIVGETVTRHVYRRSFLPMTDLAFFPEVIRLVLGIEINRWFLTPSSFFYCSSRLRDGFFCISFGSKVHRVLSHDHALYL